MKESRTRSQGIGCTQALSDRLAKVESRKKTGHSENSWESCRACGPGTAHAGRKGNTDRVGEKTEKRDQRPNGQKKEIKRGVVGHAT